MVKTERSRLEKNVKGINERIPRIAGRLISQLVEKLIEIKEGKHLLGKAKEEIEKTGKVVGILAWIVEFNRYINNIKGLEIIRDELNKILELIERDAERKKTVDVNELEKVIRKIVDKVVKLIRKKNIQELCQDEQRELLSRNLALALTILSKSDSLTVLDTIRKSIDDVCKLPAVANRLLGIIEGILQREIIISIQNENTREAVRHIFRRLFESEEVLDGLRMILYDEIKGEKLEKLYNYIFSGEKKEWRLRDLQELGIMNTVKILLLLMVACLIVIRIRGEEANLEEISLKVVELYFENSESVVKYLYGYHVVKIEYQIDALCNLQKELKQFSDTLAYFGDVFKEIREIVERLIYRTNNIIQNLMRKRMKQLA